MVGGFGLVGSPLTLIRALEKRAHARELTIVSNNLGEPGRGLGRLLLAGQVRRAVGSFFTSNPDVVRFHREQRIEIELMPQGTLAEAIRAGGAGIGGFYVPAAAQTALGERSEVRNIDGTLHVFCRPLHAQLALVRAARADNLGNLLYSRTARNFNPDMATAADVVIAEVDEIVPVGEIGPEEVVTPHIFVDYLVQSAVGIPDA